MLLSINVAPQVIQKQAGHSTINTTMDVYGHLMPEVNPNAKNAIDGLFSNEISITKAVNS